MRKLFAVFAALAIAGCQSDVMEPPATPEMQRRVDELLALLGSQYDETSDDRVRSALGLPADFPISRVMTAIVVSNGPGTVSAHFCEAAK